jgi:hypothetical protein
MNLRLPTRALVLVVVLAVLGGIFATFIVARPPSSAGDDTSNVVRPKPANPAPVKKAAPVKARKVPVKTPVKKAAKPVPAPVAKPKPLTPVKPVVAPVEPGLPKVLKSALADHRVVVVSLYDPAAAVDQLAVAEARAGASAAGAGFLALNVFREAHSRPLVELLGTLENPSVLVYRRPEALFARMGGFADRETVAQAAVNAGR